VLKDFKKIFITKTDSSSWYIFGAIGKTTITPHKRCSHCDYYVYLPYIYIIDKLKDAGLLPEDYPYLCCNCYKKDNGAIERRMIKNARNNE